MENTQNAIQVELSLQILSSDVHSMSAAMVPSAAWRLVWALGTMKNENETVLVDIAEREVKRLSRRPVNAV